MKKILCFLGITSIFLSSFCTINAQAPNLNSAANFDLFTAVGDITNTGNTQFTGSIGTNHGTISGFASLPNTAHVEDSYSASCAVDLNNAYNQLIATEPTITDHLATFGDEEILIPGVYGISGAASLNGTLTLNGQGNSNALFIFKIGGAFTTDVYSQIILTNGARADNVFWVTEGAISFAANVSVKGTFIAQAGAIGFGAFASIEGRALTLAGAITTYESWVNIPRPVGVSPNMGTAADFILFTTVGAITNTGLAVLKGKTGTNAGAVTGFEPSVPFIYIEDSVTAACAVDLSLAYTDLQTRLPNNTGHSTIFGNGETILPGVYNVGAASSLSGDVTFDAQGDPDALFVIQIGGAFTCASGTRILLADGAEAANVFWIVQGAIILESNMIATGTFFTGAGAIDIGANSSLEGRALTLSGAITMIDVTSLEVPAYIKAGPNQKICYGSSAGAIVLKGTAEPVIKWQKATNSAFEGAIDIANTTSTLSGADIENLTETTWFRPVLAEDCMFLLSAKIEVGTVTTWNGLNWDNGAPTATTNAIFTADFASTDSFDVCQVLIINNANVIINSEDTLTVQNNVQVNEGTLLFEDAASLVQISNASNSGNITYKRNTLIRRSDYTYWSSPVASLPLNLFSPLTQADRYYWWNANPSTNIGWINNGVLSGQTVMNPAQGYIIRGPQNISTTTFTPWTGVLTGIPNNGDYGINVYASDNNVFNLLGNPYPSAISADKFMDENTATMGTSGTTFYFWTHNTPIINYVYAYSDYASYNRTGGVKATQGANNEIPTGKIAAGQSFMVSAANSGVATFTNKMRIAGNNIQFYRHNLDKNALVTAEKSRLWLDIENNQGFFKEILVGYIKNATNDYENGFDGPVAEAGNSISFYSFANTKKLSIQGRRLPFDINDEVALGYKTTVASNYTITLSLFDGLFTQQSVYLEDRTLSTIHNLKESPYSFTTQAGTFDTRFVLRYTASNLNVDNPVVDSNSVVIYKQQQQIVVNTGAIQMIGVTVFDSSGRKLFRKTGINASELKFGMINTHGLLLFQIQTSDNQFITKKFIQ
ncbi:ice-binding family protein [Flavobacterium sp.]